MQATPDSAAEPPIIDQSSPPAREEYSEVFPTATQELDLIKKACPVLAPTGCTKQFCQAGRMVHIMEPRVGRDRPFVEQEEEAIAFLVECRKLGIITSDEALQQRLKDSAAQMKAGAVETVVIDTEGKKSKGKTAGNWHLEFDELKAGVRAAWRNARRCIMRSQHMELELVDVRHIKKSKEMAEAIIDGMTKAFGGGNITPTAIVFPPREPGKRGPMVWNGQILAFAGYRQDDDSILGDPGNVELTESFIQFGWKAPDAASRTPWDLLPLITMAEDDEPYMIELPEALRQVVNIRHPKYRDEFEQLDLKWVAAPALSRFGFDIGGVQFTASPFIGWFMDAEIGVRNLADSFRYNVLPRVVEVLKLHDHPGKNLEDLAEYERLAAMSRAQSELNYAVYWSYLQAKVIMVDSFTASAEYCEYDDELRQQTGFRQPADPYWISPPQGSVVPIWHRGGAPNYQPKPMICKHAQDPINAWKREHQDQTHAGDMHKMPASQLQQSARLTAASIIYIYYASAGITASKLAHRLHTRASAFVKTRKGFGIAPKPEPLDRLDLAKLRTTDVVLLIVSTTGHGNMPVKGAQFLKRTKTMGLSKNAPRYSVFGNGDTHYGDTYNAAAIFVRDAMKRIGASPLADGFFEADTSVDNPPWKHFETWWETMRIVLSGSKEPLPTPPTIERVSSLPHHHGSAAMADAVRVKSGVVKVTLDLGEEEYQEMDHLKLFPPNLLSETQRAVRILQVGANEQLKFASNLTVQRYLRECVDLEQPFKTMHWLDKLEGLHGAEIDMVRSMPVIDALEFLGYRDYSPLLEDVCADMNAIQPRSYSVASSSHAPGAKGKGHVDILVRVHPGGRFSDRFLTHTEQGAALRYALKQFPAWELFANSSTAPVICVAIGSGLGPVRGFLQWRVAEANKAAASADSDKPFVQHPISLFAGFKEADFNVLHDAMYFSQQAGLFDILELVQSNSAKIRAQDKVLDPSIAPRIAKKLRDPGCLVFVCSNEACADAAAANFSTLLGSDVKELLGSRYVEEVFRSAN